MKSQPPRATGPADDHAEGFIRTLLAGPNGRLSQAFENACSFFFNDTATTEIYT